MRVEHGDCLEVMRRLADEGVQVDAVVTDPPYGLEFMGKDWDSFKTYSGGNPEMKPQGAVISKGHESYGYRQKNPRCRGCGKLKRGNGACKCPSPNWDTRTSESAFQFQAFCEDWASLLHQLLKPGGHVVCFSGTRTFHRLISAIEDAGFEIRDCLSWLYGTGYPRTQLVEGGWSTMLRPGWEPICLARKPLQRETVAQQIRETGTGAVNIGACKFAGSDGEPRWPANVAHDGGQEVLAALGSAARFFYSGKANATDRAGSKHPTVKPVALMRWLCRLVTPPGGVILDPFAGSGTTGQAAAEEGFDAILIEREAEYVADIRNRLGRDLFAGAA